MAEKISSEEPDDISKGLIDKLVKEFESWQEVTGSDKVFLLDTFCEEDDRVTLHMILSSEHEFTVYIKGERKQEFEIKSEPCMRRWAAAMNQFISDGTNHVSLTDILERAVSLNIPANTTDVKTSESDEDLCELDEVSDEDVCVQYNTLFDEEAFTTEKELHMAIRKKHWAKKEAEMREEMKRKKLLTNGEIGAHSATSEERKQAQQIFTSTEASGILTNDLVRILETGKEDEFSVEPINDNIYMWKIRLFNFQEGSHLSKELKEIEEKFGYNCIELELTFDIDLYPFFPPQIRVIRPRLKGALMQMVTNMELLKLSQWRPTRDMKSVIIDIKNFVQQWARLEVDCERNDPVKYPLSSFFLMEHHLLRLALVSEVNPRVNCQFGMSETSSPVKPPSPPKIKKEDLEVSDEFWAPGIGFGHNKRPEWDINAYLAAQKEKDNQVQSVLHQILEELRLLYANHAPQLKPRLQRAEGNVGYQEVDPVLDMYDIIEGSALIPFIEQYLRADSFLEIARHKVVYKAIIDILKEIALQSQLLPLVCTLPNQQSSVYELLEVIEKKASLILQHLGKVGNGSVPKDQQPVPHHIECVCSPPTFYSVLNSMDCVPMVEDSVNDDEEDYMEIVVNPHHSDPSQSTEERLARDFATLFKDITDSLKRNGIYPRGSQLLHSPNESCQDQIDKTSALEAQYCQLLKSHIFDSHEIDVEGPNAHHFSKLFNKARQPSQSEVFRIAQEITSLSSSLPLTLSSSIFVRMDDEKLNCMRALITGPEGTPYSGGCFLFDIYFPANYPSTPPLVNLQTTGGGRVRFNPNLYSCGRVCLSLLGTWQGQKGERWNEKTSTVLQVLVSIQSLILVPEPYFNEPGYEQEIGTVAGGKHSSEYNTAVQINTIRHAMIEQLHNPPQGFEEMIQLHFYIKRERILKEVKDWLKECKIHSSKMERSIQYLKKELYKLKPPANLLNLSPESVVTNP